MDTEDRTRALRRDAVVEGRRRVAEDPRRGGEAATGVGDQVIGTDGKTAEIVEIDRDDARQVRGASQDQLVAHSRGVEVEAKRRAISHRQGHTQVRGGIAVEEVEGRTRGDVDRTEAGGSKAGVEDSLRDDDAARAEVGGVIDGDRTGAGLGENAGSAGQSAIQGERAGLVGCFNRTAR